MSQDSIATVSNALLVDRFRNEDRSAFDELFRRHRGLVFRVCLKWLRHHQDAEDVMQETFRRLARSIDRWDNRRPLEPWLATIAGNACRTFLHRRRTELTGADWSEASPTIPTRTADDAGHVAGDMMLMRDIVDILQQVPPPMAQAFELVHQRGLSYQAVAEELHQPVGTIKTWVHRTRLQLIDALRSSDAPAASEVNPT